MDVTVQVAIVGSAATLVTGLLTYYLAPHINWRIERKKDQLKRQHELIDQWRTLVENMMQYWHRQYDPSREYEHLGPNEFLTSRKEFYSLKPYLSDQIEELLLENYFPNVAEYLTNEIARIEQDWKLVPRVDKSKKLKKTAS